MLVLPAGIVSSDSCRPAAADPPGSGTIDRGGADTESGHTATKQPLLLFIVIHYYNLLLLFYLFITIYYNLLLYICYVHVSWLTICSKTLTK